MSRRAKRLLDEAFAALGARNPTRARSRARMALKHTDEPLLRAEAYHLFGRLELDGGDAAAALGHLDRAGEMGADYADLHYDRAIACELLGDEAGRRRAFLATLERDLKSPSPVERLLDEDALVGAAEETLEELPEEIVARLGNVPIIVEERPGVDLVEQGFDPRSLGLFEGAPWSEQGLTGPSLGRIVLYRANISAVARTVAEAEAEVRITVLHETGHFFGLDEDQLHDLGLG